MIAMLLLYVIMGAAAGYQSANLYKTFRGKQWQKCTLLTAFLYPGVAFILFLTFNLTLWGEGSSGAVPFLSMVALISLWFGISVPLVFLGAYIGFRKDVMEFPVHPRSGKWRWFGPGPEEGRGEPQERPPITPLTHTLAAHPTR